VPFLPIDPRLAAPTPGQLEDHSPAAPRLQHGDGIPDGRHVDDPTRPGHQRSLVLVEPAGTLEQGPEEVSLDGEEPAQDGAVLERSPEDEGVIVEGRVDEEIAVRQSDRRFVLPGRERRPQRRVLGRAVVKEIDAPFAEARQDSLLERPVPSPRKETDRPSVPRPKEALRAREESPVGRRQDAADLAARRSTRRAEEGQALRAFGAHGVRGRRGRGRRRLAAIRLDPAGGQEKDRRA
jgi:hypothetical protein